MREALENPRRDTERIVLPPASYLHEQEKIEQRWPAAVKFIKERKLNEFFGPETADVGIVVQGGMYNSVMRSLQQLGLADVYGETAVPIYVLNVTYPLIDDEVAAFAANKKAILMVEEGQPEFIEQALNTILRRRDIQTKISGKDVLPMAGEYTARGRHQGHQGFSRAACQQAARQRPAAPGRFRGARRSEGQGARQGGAAAAARLLHRLPGAADLRGDEARRSRSSASTTSPPTSAATCSRSCRRSISAPPPWATD